MKTLKVHAEQISLSTTRILEKRDKEVKGHSFYRGADAVTTFFYDYRFSLARFKESYPRDHERIEAAVPIDLLYLHLFATANGYDEILISPHADPDPRLPWYGGGNRLLAEGSVFTGLCPQRAGRVPRQYRTGGVIEGFDPAQFRTGIIQLCNEPEPVPEPA